MKKEEIYFGDWKRLLLGQAPEEFLLEVVVRTLIMYVVLLVVLRLFGKRLNVRLTITELAVLFTLGTLASNPMQVPDKGIVVALVLLLIPLLLLRGVNWLAFHKRSVEILTQGKGSALVKDGVLQLKAMHKAGFSRDQVLASLRMQQIRHLGEVKRAYLEAHGPVSVFKRKKAEPGLSVLPDEDKQYHKAETQADALACHCCGTLVQEQQPGKCANCQRQEWVQAINPN